MNALSPNRYSKLCIDYSTDIVGVCTERYEKSFILLINALRYFISMYNVSPYQHLIR